VSTQNRKYELKVRAQRQQETRRRIVEATVELHREVGPARTTVAEIARRAGIRRMTVYDHFPDEADLFAACQARFLADHPPPDLTRALAQDDPHARVRAVVRALYRSYRARAPMTEKVLRDRAALPALDALLARTMDAQLNHLVDALAKGFGARGVRARRIHAVLSVALDFFTWQRLTRKGLDDDAAAALMSDVVSHVGG
jgi:AcrR family transcriptional regulator